jgi:hypothetical protein
VTTIEVWDELLLPLADVFESGKPQLAVDIGPMFAETYEPVRECLAMKVAEGSVVAAEGLPLYRLTANGYGKYKARIDALRTVYNL